MKRDQAIEVITDHYKKLRRHLNQIFPGFDSEAIHKFRVEYKKLRAFFRMISSQPEIKNDIKVSKELKKAYNISGAIRDMQLQQSRILHATASEPKRPQAYLHLLQKEIEKLKPELAEIISEKPVSLRKEKTAVLITDEFRFQGLPQFVEKKWSSINAIVASADFSDDNIHVIRKALKDLFYNLKIIQDTGKRISAKAILNEKNEQWMDKFLEELGDFQNKCRSIALLKSYWIISLNTYNQDLLNRLKKSWIKEKLSLKQMLIRKIKSELVQQNSSIPGNSVDNNH